MKRIAIWGLVLGAVLAAYVRGYLWGMWDGIGKHAIEEAKICCANLDFYTNGMSPQAREYMKARLYWNSAQHIPAKDFAFERDYGPIDLTVLGTLLAAKDPTASYATYYEEAKAKHLRPRGPNVQPQGMPRPARQP